LELNYPEKLTHGKDYQWLKYMKVRPQNMLSDQLVMWPSNFAEGPEAWDGIFKLLRSPGIDYKESIPPAYVS
jgi:hypothetical protein